jgi:hypothetical protein
LLGPMLRRPENGVSDGHAWTDALTRSLWLHISTERAFTSPVVGLQRTWSPTYRSSQVSISDSFANSFGILVFLEKKTQKSLCNSLAYWFGIFWELAKERAIGAYMRASGSRASAWHRSFSRGSSLLSGALPCLAGLFIRLAGLFVS